MPPYRQGMSIPVATRAPAQLVTAPALVLAGVTRRHGGRSTWAPLDLQLEAGTVTVLTGDNGSGKTTLLRLAAGLLRPSTGTRLCPGAALYVRAGAGLRGAQTVVDAVATTAGLRGHREQAAAAVALVGLAPLARRRVGSLSAGERVRAALAMTVAARPALVCLDEPTGVLDAPGLELLTVVLSALREGGTSCVVATHQPAAVLAVADAHLQFTHGRLVAA